MDIQEWQSSYNMGQSGSTIGPAPTGDLLRDMHNSAAFDAGRQSTTYNTASPAAGYNSTATYSGSSSGSGGGAAVLILVVIGFIAIFVGSSGTTPSSPAPAYQTGQAASPASAYQHAQAAPIAQPIIFHRITAGALVRTTRSDVVFTYCHKGRSRSLVPGELLRVTDFEPANGVIQALDSHGNMGTLTAQNVTLAPPEARSSLPQFPPASIRCMAAALAKPQ